jgi:hypothetical protein
MEPFKPHNVPVPFPSAFTGEAAGKMVARQRITVIATLAIIFKIYRDFVFIKPKSPSAIIDIGDFIIGLKSKLI